MIDDSLVTIRPARDAEARAGRILLPEMFTANQAPELLVAVRGADQDVVGALGLGTVLAPTDASIAALAHVVPPARRRGVGRALIEAGLAWCEGRGAVMRALRPVPAESQAATFLEACGFDQYDHIRHFEADTASFHATMQALRQALERSGRVPEAARVVTLRAAPRDEVARLVSRHFPVTPARVLERLEPDAPDRYDLDHSVALLLGERVGGALIYNWNGGLPVIEVRVVDAALRGGWANVLILEQATRNGLAAGATRFRFFADVRIEDTMKLARRAGAEEIRSERHYWRRVT